MRIATLCLALFLANLVIPATDAIAGENVYRWVDEDGNLHFGDKPPEQADVEKINVRKDRSAGLEVAPEPGEPPTAQQPSYAQQLREQRALERKEYAKKQVAIAKGCEQRLAVKAQLEPKPRVMVTTEQGEVYRMNDDDRIKELATINEYLDKNCKD